MKLGYGIHLQGTPKLAFRGHPSYLDSLWWNNSDGWGHKTTADYFTPQEKDTLSLPLDGEWVEIYLES
jgi:hypothetical protein